MAPEKPCVLACDIGTGGVKVAVYDAGIHLLDKEFVPYHSIYPGPEMVEQDPEAWWDGITEATKRIIARNGDVARRIAAIAVDAMSPVLVACDARGNALRPAIIWMDRRTTEQCARINEVIGDDLFRITGNHNDPSNFAPKAMWLREHEGSTYARTAVLHTASGYVVHRLTGTAIMDVTQCGLSQLCATERSAWDAQLVKGCGLNLEKLPEIVESAHIVGQLTDDAARQLHLPSGIPVVAGSMDNVAAGLGLGVTEHHEAYVSAGTATNLCVCSDSPRCNRAFHLYRHIMPNRFLSVAGVDYGGAGVKWFKELLGEVSYRHIDEMADAAMRSPLPLLYLPYLVGQRAPLWDSTTTGVLLGLHPSTSRNELFRALMEGNALGLQRVLTIFSREGFPVTAARMTGGASQSRTYAGICADALGIPLEIFDDGDVAVRGTAITALVASGVQPSWEAAVAGLHARHVVEPDPARHRYFREMGELFAATYEDLKKHFATLERIRTEHREDNS